MTWEQVALADLADIQGGIQKQPKRAPRLNAFPFLRVANVTSHGLDLTNVHEVELFGDELKRLRLQRGDLLVVEGNGSPSQIGRAAVWNGSIDDCVHQNHLIRVRPREQLLPSFLGLVWNSPVVRDELTAVSSSTSGLHTLSVAKLKRIALPLPSLAEQARVVEILEDHLSHLDAGASELARGRGRLDALWASALSEARIGAALALPEVAEVQGGIQKQPRRAPRENHYPFLRVANVTSSGLDLADVHRVELFGDELTRLRLEPGDLLVVEGNGSASQIGRAAMWDGSIGDCVHQNHLIRVRPKESMLPGYLEAVWNSPEHRRKLMDVASSSSGLYTLSVSKLKRLTVPVPSLHEQQGVVDRIGEIRTTLRRLDKAVSAALTRAETLRRAVLAAAFEGTLTGRHTDQEVIEELAEA